MSYHWGWSSEARSRWRAGENAGKQRITIAGADRRFVVACCLLSIGLVIAAVCPRTAGALTINLTYDQALAEPPSFDPTGQRLGTIARAAASVWEDIIEDRWTMELAYTWGDLSDALGEAATRRTNRGRVTDARVRFDTLDDSNREIDWYFDPTPSDDSEYDLQQFLYRDLTASQRADWFSGSPPDLLEVSFAGIAASTASPEVINGFDLFSVALHEIGHALGLSENVTSIETFDLDYDFARDSIGGATAAALTASSADRSHLAASRTLMFPSFVEGIRRLPSATDIFSIATGSGWNSLDLPRQDFLRGSDWEVAANWEGNQVPDASDQVFVRHGGSVTIGRNTNATSLLVADATTLRTGDRRLNVANELVIAGSDAGAPTRMVVQELGLLTADSLTIQDAGRLVMQGGTVNVRSDLVVDTGSIISGYGAIMAEAFRNEGILSVTSATTIDGEVDFRDGSISTLGANLQLTGNAAVRRDARISGVGSLIVSSGSVLDLQDGATTNVKLVNQGRVDLARGPTAAAVTEYSQSADATLNLEVGGTVPGATHDQLRVSGKAMLDGTLAVFRVGDYTPAVGETDSITLVSTNRGVEGVFDEAPAGHQGNGLFIDLVYGEKDVVLEVLKAFPGDANGDSVFNQRDIVQVSRSAKYLTGLPADWTEGDWNDPVRGGDGLFDQKDILAALTSSPYLGGASGARNPDSTAWNAPASLGYGISPGELRTDSYGGRFSASNLASSEGIFTGESVMKRGGVFDEDIEDQLVVELVYNPVPEPSTFVLVCLAFTSLCATVWLQGRRR